MLTVERVDVVVLEVLRLAVSIIVVQGWRQVGSSIPHQLGHELLGEVLGIGGSSCSIGMEDLVPVSRVLLPSPSHAPTTPAHHRGLTTTRRLQNLVESTTSVERFGIRLSFTLLRIDLTS